MSNMRFIPSLTIAILAFAFLVLASEESLSQASKPNIVLILADDLGYGEVSVYPSQSKRRIATPNLKKLAKKGIVFTDAYAGIGVCAPSRAALLTGKHMGHATIRGNKHIAGHDMPLKASDTSIAQVLKRSGYSTGVFGKWGLGYFGTSGAPKAKGFDTFYGQLGQGACHNYYPTKVDASDASGIRHVPIAENKGATRKKCMSPGNTCVFSPDLFVKKGLEWMKQQKGTPFFMYLALTPPHAGGYPPNGKQTGAPVPRQGIYKKKPWPTVEKDHAAQVTYAVDAYVGKVVENLKAMGEYKNTLVIFTSDNGPHNEGGKHDVRYFDSAGPLRGFKRSLYEGGIRIPMIMSWPGKIKPSSKSREPIAFWDFLPTLGKIGQAASSVPKNIDGVDISPIFAGKKLPKRALYWEFCTNKKWGHAIRFGDWKAVSFSLDGPMELYNIRKDRGEKHNLAKKNRKLVKALEAKAKTMRSSDKEWPKKNCVTS